MLPWLSLSPTLIGYKVLLTPLGGLHREARFSQPLSSLPLADRFWYFSSQAWVNSRLQKSCSPCPNGTCPTRTWKIKNLGMIRDKSVAEQLTNSVSLLWLRPEKQEPLCRGPGFSQNNAVTSSSVLPPSVSFVFRAEESKGTGISPWTCINFQHRARDSGLPGLFGISQSACLVFIYFLAYKEHCRQGGVGCHQVLLCQNNRMMLKCRFLDSIPN